MKRNIVSTVIIVSFFPVVSCNFDNDVCGFVQDSNDKFDWTRNKGGTGSYQTGPSADHTTGNGMKYLPLLHRSSQFPFSMTHITGNSYYNCNNIANMQ